MVSGRVRLTRTLTAAACGMLVACADPASRDSTQGAIAPSTESSGTHSAPQAPDDSSGAVDIGGGRHLYVQCAGEGMPTILLEAGDNSDTRQWSPVYGRLSEQTRTCAYDRAGLGRSDAAKGCRQLDDLLDDTESLLEAADIDPPYLLVGTSGGGYLMAGLAARHPDDVDGLVLLETPKAITVLPSAEILERIRCGSPNNKEHRDYIAVEHAVWDQRKEIGDFPLHVMSNDYDKDFAIGDDLTNAEDQRGWLVLSPNAKQVVVTSGHDVVSNETDRVLQSIAEVLREARRRDE